MAVVAAVEILALKVISKPDETADYIVFGDIELRPGTTFIGDEIRDSMIRKELLSKRST